MAVIYQKTAENRERVVNLRSWVIVPFDRQYKSTIMVFYLLANNSETFQRFQLRVNSVPLITWIVQILIYFYHIWLILHTFLILLIIYIPWTN